MSDHEGILHTCDIPHEYLTGLQKLSYTDYFVQLDMHYIVLSKSLCHKRSKSCFVSLGTKIRIISPIKDRVLKISWTHTYNGTWTELFPQYGNRCGAD